MQLLQVCAVRARHGAGSVASGQGWWRPRAYTDYSTSSASWAWRLRVAWHEASRQRRRNRRSSYCSGYRPVSLAAPIRPDGDECVAESRAGGWCGANAQPESAARPATNTWSAAHTGSATGTGPTTSAEPATGTDSATNTGSATGAEPATNTRSATRTGPATSTGSTKRTGSATDSRRAAGNAADSLEVICFVGRGNC